MSNPRILHVTREFSDRALGGIEQSIVLAAQDTNFSHQVLALGRPGDASQSQCHGLDVHRVFPIGSVKFFPWAPRWFRVLRALARDSDIIHLHSPFPLGEFSVSGVDRPIVCTYHAEVSDFGWLGWLYQKIQVRLLETIPAIIATSPAYATTAVPLKQCRDRVHVVPFGLPEEAREPVRPEVQLPARFFLFVGSKRRYKGLSVLLAAARDAGYPVVIAGAGQEAGDGSSDTNQVIWLGSVTESEKVWLLQHADALILPSTTRAEAFGIVLLEAMRQRLPCICTKLGTGADWLVRNQETGLVVEPGDARQLSEAMTRMYADAELRHTLGQAGRDRFERDFALSCYHQNLGAVYRQVLV